MIISLVERMEAKRREQRLALSADSRIEGRKCGVAPNDVVSGMLVFWSGTTQPEPPKAA